MIGAGAFVAYAGVLVLAAALVLVLFALGVAAWVATILIGAALLIVGYGTVQSGRRSMKQGPPPLQRTKETSIETVHHIKEQLR
jgi:membrane protein implicated in regulation of membrane protease activity